MADIVAGAQGQHRIHKVAQAFVPNALDEPGLHGGIVVHDLDAVKIIVFLDGRQHLVCHFQGDLAAVSAVYFVAIVLGGVVAGGDADACAAPQIPGRPGEGGGGLQTGIEESGDPVGSQDPGCFTAKQLALMTAVVGDGYTFGQPAGVQVVGQTLRSPADGVDVHAVGAGADDAAQPAGTKGKVPVEAVGYGVRVRLNGFQFPAQVGVVGGSGQPEMKCG